MFKTVIGVLTFLFVAGSSLAYAQEASPPVPSQANFKVFTDARIGMVKAALQLTPEQEKLWPPVEEAIRARAETRYNRMVAMAAVFAGLLIGLAATELQIKRYPVARSLLRSQLGSLSLASTK
jgi:hypothetical protein